MTKTGVLRFFLILLIAGNTVLQAQVGTTSGSFVPGSRDIVLFDFASDAVGTLPRGMTKVDGTLAVVDKDGKRILKASQKSTFVVTLPEPLPQNFTIEYDLLPRQTSNFSMEEIQFEATQEYNAGPNSAFISWGQHNVTVTGGGASVDAPFPEDLRLEMQGSVAHIGVAMNGTSFKMYTNGRELISVPDLKIPRSSVLRTILWSMDDRDNAVYLTRFRIAAVDPTISRTVAPGTRLGDVPLSSAPAPAALSGTLAPLTETSSLAAIAGDRTYVAPGSNTPVKLQVGTDVVDAFYLKGGFGTATVVEESPVNGTTPKHLGAIQYDPIVIETFPAAALSSWMNSAISGSTTRKSGVLYGVGPDGQQLEFSNALVTKVALPAMDAAISSAVLLNVTLAPERTRLAPAGTVPASAPRSAVPIVANFRLTIPGLETSRVARIEPFSAAITGDSSKATSPQLTNLVVTLATDAASPIPGWLAWYDSFVLNGKNSNDQEKTFSLELLDSTMKSTLVTLNGTGVGISTLRILPSAPGSTIRKVQAELYVESVELKMK